MKNIILARRGELLLMEDSGTMRLPTEEEIPLPEGAETFEFDGFAAYGAEGEWPSLQGARACGLRESWKFLPEEQYRGAAKGVELLNWNAEERYCSRDGAPLSRFSSISKKCPKCGAEYFPRLSPAIVVLVKRGEEALLVHSRNLKNDVMALVAGFVETGESLEECVAREVREETSLEICNVRYWGSQAWPFPHQLMVGFTADYKGGEIRFADGELTSGAFFRRGSAPVVPSMPSLSRMIIDAWLKGEL